MGFGSYKFGHYICSEHIELCYHNDDSGFDENGFVEYGEPICRECGWQQIHDSIKNIDDYPELIDEMKQKINNMSKKEYKNLKEFVQFDNVEDWLKEIFHR